jgi:hypothetical protein
MLVDASQCFVARSVKGAGERVAQPSWQKALTGAQQQDDALNGRIILRVRFNASRNASPRLKRILPHCNT